MTRCTSKASLLDEKAKGNVSTQEDKIFDIINLGGNLSLQEIMQIYRGKHGNIELSSVSARCNKLKADGKVFEDKPRKCAVTDKAINPLTANTCTHDRYRKPDYMCAPTALKNSNIAWVGMIVQKCESCGADISHAKRAQVKTAEEYMREVNK